jgi:hypothetical protein
LWLEYHPLVVSYARGDIGPQFARAYRLPIPKYAPFAIGYAFEGKPHEYLPDVVGRLSDGTPFIAEAGMEDDKRSDRNLAKAEAARRLSRIEQGTFWIGTERRLSKHYHYNLVYLHARRKHFPAFDDIALALQEIWPRGDVASVEEIESRLAGKWPESLVEAAIWKVAGDSAAAGHLLVDLEQHTLDRKLPLALLPPEAPPWFLIHFPTRSCLNQKTSPLPLIRLRAYRFPAQRLMRLPLMRSGVTSFTATWLPYRRCWLVPRKPAWQRSQGLHAQRFRDWFGEQSN